VVTIGRKKKGEERRFRGSFGKTALFLQRWLSKKLEGEEEVFSCTRRGEKRGQLRLLAIQDNLTARGGWNRKGGLVTALDGKGEQRGRFLKRTKAEEFLEKKKKKSLKGQY